MHFFLIFLWRCGYFSVLSATVRGVSPDWFLARSPDPRIGQMTLIRGAHRSFFMRLRQFAAHYSHLDLHPVRDEDLWLLATGKALLLLSITYD